MADKNCEILIVGATPAGIAAGVRAAREGSRVVIATETDHLGGMVSNGIGTADTVYRRQRAPVLDEFFGLIADHYRDEYGDSAEYYPEDLGGHGHVPLGHLWEPHVAREVFEDLVEGESRLEILFETQVETVTRSGTSIESVSLETNGGDALSIQAEIFIDATYVGDLAAVAGVSYRVGRESRDEYGEPHAGRLFTGSNSGDTRYPRAAVRGELNINRTMGRVSGEIFSGSTGEGDGAIQAYNYRLCLSRDPENRRRPEKPPEYDRSRYLGIVTDEADAAADRHPISSGLITKDVHTATPDDGGLVEYSSTRLPGQKLDWNASDFPGGADGYPEADPETRESIANRHLDHAQGLLYFLQNDEAVPDEQREKALEWGLAEDEFEDNDNVPERMYVREGRRIVGRTTFTEHDARVAPGLDRTPVKRDAISMGEWIMECHEVSPERTPGSRADGNFYLSELTRPSHVPFGAVLPRSVSNLLVPVSMSATHVGFQTLRVEPTLMQIGEAAGMAGAIAARQGQPLDSIPVLRLQRALVEAGSVITFFNDLTFGEPWTAAVQLLGTKGYFPSYDGRFEDSLRDVTARRWITATERIIAGELSPSQLARDLAGRSLENGQTVTADEFVDRLFDVVQQSEANPPDQDYEFEGQDEVMRGDACRVIYDTITDLPDSE